MAVIASQAGDSEPSKAPGLTSAFQGSLTSSLNAITVHYCFGHSDDALVLLYETTIFDILENLFE